MPKVRDMVNFYQELTEMPTMASPSPGSPISTFEPGDLPAMHAMGADLWHGRTQKELWRTCMENPFFPPESLFVIRGRTDRTPLAVAILIEEPGVRRPEADRREPTVFPARRVRREWGQPKRVNGLFSFVAAKDRSAFAFALDLMSHAATKLDGTSADPLAAQVPSDVPHLLMFYQSHFRRQGSSRCTRKFCRVGRASGASEAHHSTNWSAFVAFDSSTHPTHQLHTIPPPNFVLAGLCRSPPPCLPPNRPPALSTKSALPAIDYPAIRTWLLVFFTPHHADAAPALARSLHERLRPQCMFGGIGEAVVGTGREIEHQAGLSLWLGKWSDGAELQPCHLTPQQTSDGLSLLGWPDALVEGGPDPGTLLLLGDPFTFPAQEIFLPQVDADYPGLRVHGGMASGMAGPGQTPLILGPEVVDVGAVGVLLRGRAGVRSVVSQGCRPIGVPLVVTKGHENVIHELGGQPAMARLKAMYDELPPHDQDLFQRGPHVGIAMTEYRERLRPRRFPGPQLVQRRPRDRGDGDHGPRAGRANGAIPRARR